MTSLPPLLKALIAELRKGQCDHSARCDERCEIYDDIVSLVEAKANLVAARFDEPKTVIICEDPKMVELAQDIINSPDHE